MEHRFDLDYDLQAKYSIPGEKSDNRALATAGLQLVIPNHTSKYDPIEHPDSDNDIPVVSAGEYDRY